MKIGTLIFGWLVLLVGMGPAQGRLQPGQLGIHRAALTEKARLELTLDALRSAARRGNITTGLPLAETLTWRLGASLDVAMLQSILAEEGDIPTVVMDAQAAVVEFSGGNRLVLQRDKDTWTITHAERRYVAASMQHADESPGDLVRTEFDAGATFLKTPLSPDHGIVRLNPAVTRSRIDRELFGAPEKSAAYYHAIYRKDTPLVDASYVQLVLDPAWNRVVYGSLERWINTYDDVIGPVSIAVDPQGRVFIGESGRSRVTVLQLETSSLGGDLRFLFAIEAAGLPLSLALDDRGTPFQINDDRLYVADGIAEVIREYALGADGARLTSVYEDMIGIVEVCTGKHDGLSNGRLYVIDQSGKRLRALTVGGGTPVVMNRLDARPGEYFQTMRVDHFGNIYLVDALGKRLLKLDSQLNALDQLESGEAAFDGLSGIDIPFGRVSIEGEGDFWVGFDQLFTVERWDATAGAQRFALKTAIRQTRLEARDDAKVQARFVLTDAAGVSAYIFDDNNRLVATLGDSWMNAGEKTLAWDRRDADGRAMNSGDFRLAIEARSTYTDEKTVLDLAFYLPLLVHLDFEHDGILQADFVERGRMTVRDSIPVLGDPERVTLRFAGLDPESEYAVRVQGPAQPGQSGGQRLLAGGDGTIKLAVIARGGASPYIDLPQKSFDSGVFTLQVEGMGGQPAAITQAWLRETGRPLQARAMSDAEPTPAQFVLLDNYPNPFNPETTIRYRLTRSARIELVVFNILGEKLRTLVAAFREGGTHAVRWDGRDAAGHDVASGFYFYRLSANDFSEVKRMLLVR